MATLAQAMPAGSLHQVVFDVRNPQASWYACMLDLVSEYGTPELLVVAHGAAPAIAPAIALEGHHFADVLLTDVWGAFMACQSVGNYMVQQKRGTIVLLSSLHAKQTYPQRVAYSMAKSALSGLVRSLAIEWGPSGVRTNAILPWQCTGPRTEAFLAAAHAQGEDLEEAYLRKSPLRRLITPEDIAETVLWLARTESINGAEIIMDGGVSQSMWYQPFLGG
jgi:NAD(P)-dependent dehydrogenase (short-subunit alcohol dehydrogenase family)